MYMLAVDVYLTAFINVNQCSILDCLKSRERQLPHRVEASKRKRAWGSRLKNRVS